MRLKTYLEFIKESLKEDIKEGKFYLHDLDDILEYFIELEDAGFDITVDVGFMTKDDKFSELPLAGQRTPCYQIFIELKKENNNDENFIDSLIFAYDMLKSNISEKIHMSDKYTFFTEEDIKKYDYLSIKNGLIYKKTSPNSSEYTKIQGGLEILVEEPNPIKITPKEMSDYYGWEYDHVDKDGDIYFDIDTEDLSDILINGDDNYKPILDNGMEAIWDWYYDSSNYQPDTISFFQYSLTKENEPLMVKAMIKEVGGLEEFVYHIANETDEDLSGKTEEEVIDFLLKERYYHTLSQLSSNSEIYGEILNLVADWEMGSHATENYNQIISKFEDKVEEHFDYRKIEKEVEKSYTVSGEKKTYKENVTFYRILFEEKWLSAVEDWSDDDMRRYIKSVRDLCVEWAGGEWLKESLNPYLSDYGSVDTKEMNKDIKHQLEAYLKD